MHSTHRALSALVISLGLAVAGGPATLAQEPLTITDVDGVECRDPYRVSLAAVPDEDGVMIASLDESMVLRAPPQPAPGRPPPVVEGG